MRPGLQAEIDRASQDPHKRFGRYLLLERLGKGAYAVVQRAWDPGLRRQVAIKLLTREDERARKRFRREAEVLARLRHPNIVTVHDHGDERGAPYIVMAYLTGSPLEGVNPSPTSDSRDGVHPGSPPPGLGRG